MSTNFQFLHQLKLTENGRPILYTNEIEHSLISSVDILSDDIVSFPFFKSYIAILTTHRLILQSPDSQTQSHFISLSDVKNIVNSKKSVKSMFQTPRIKFQVNECSGFVTLVLRGKKSDPDVFLGKFFDVWRKKEWESSGSGLSGSGGSGLAGSGVDSGLAIRMPVVGVAGILRKEQEMWENTDKSLSDAFQDLNALMSKAKEMVMLAEKMRQKLLSGSSNQASGTADDEMGTKEEMQDWMLSVGIVSPVTKETAGALYHQQLSRQLADFVKKPLDRAGGMLNLIDVYCLFNRARGTELISPDDLLQACLLWEKFDVSVMLRKFDSGVMVIQSKTHSDDEVYARISSLIVKPEALLTGISATDAAMTLGVAPAMAKEYLLAAEAKGLLCRDVSPDGFRFYINFFLELDPHNIHLVKEHSRYSTWIGAVSSR